MAEWFSTPELAGLPGMPTAPKNVRTKAENEAWLSRPREGRGGGREYHLSSLPDETRRAIALTHLAGANGNVATTTQPTALPLSPKGLDRKASARLAVLDALDAFNALGGFSERRGRELFCADYNAGEIDVDDWVRKVVAKVSPRTIHNWRDKVKSKDYEGLAGRQGKHRRGSGIIDRTPAIRDFIVGTLAQMPHANSRQIERLLHAWLEGTDEEAPGYPTIQRFVKRWKEENEAVFLAHRDPDAFRSKFGVAFGSASEAVTALNQVWELDSTPADVICADGRRYAIVACIDIWSRRAKVRVTPTSCAAAILLVMRDAINAWGVPAIAKTDNGSDYKGKQMTRAFVTLGIQQRLCPPYTPEGKPHVERFIQTLLHQFAELLPGFIGHSVAQRKEIENRRSFADRMEKKRPELRPVEVALDAAELQDRLSQWCDQVYNHQSHSGLKGDSPFQKAATWRGEVSRIADERALDVLLAEAPGGDGKRVATKSGVSVHGDHFMAPELVSYIGESVQVRLDPSDMGQVIVYEASNEGRFITIARNAEMLGADRRTVAMQAKKLQRHIVSEGRRELTKAARRTYRDGDVAKRLLGNAAEAAEVVVAIPAPAVAHETPALTAAGDAARALDRRGPSAPVLTPEIQARRDALAAEFKSAAPTPAATSTDRKSRFERALKIEAAISDGAPVPDEDWDWLRGYQQTPEYRAQKHMNDDLRGGGLRIA